MGKGDKRSVKGKRVLGTFGVVRPRRSQKATAKTSKKKLISKFFGQALQACCEFHLCLDFYLEKRLWQYG